MGTIVKRGEDTLTLKLVSCEISEQKSSGGNDYEAVVAGFASSKGSTWENKFPTFPTGGGYNPNSPGGRFLDALEAACRAGGLLNGASDFDTSIAEGKVFTFAKVGRFNKNGTPITDGNGEQRTDLVPRSLVGDTFPNQ